MSLISAIAGNASGIFQWLQQATSSVAQSTGSAASSSSSNNSNSASNILSASGLGTTSEMLGHHGHHHHGSQGGLNSNLESAVTGALQNLPSGSNPNAAIQNA